MAIWTGWICASLLVLQPALASAAAPVPPRPTSSGNGAPVGGDPAGVCKALKDIDFSLTKDAPSLIVSAVAQPANVDMPDLCLVNGRIAPTIGYRMWLPLTTWNGKFAQGGCGGRCGDILDDGCQIVVARGYACIAADLGHKGTFYDDLWAIDNVSGDIDFGFRATHVTNITGKAVTEAFYGKKPRYSYYFGASTGGRQGLIEAQRFPEDFDGIVAGEPAMGTPGSPRPETGPALRGNVAMLHENGKPIITPTDIMLLHDRAIAQCDLDDHAQDGIISDPRRCTFKPTQLLCKGDKTPACLTQKQVAALESVYANGPLPGSEIAWLGAYIGKDGGPGRYLWKLKNPYHYPYAWMFNDATNPDLRAFKAKGGKLILYQGWADEATYPLNPVLYYETVEKLMGGRGKTQDFFRLFMIPGESHIPATAGGAETVDYLSYIEGWVERGETPDVLLAQKMKTLARFAGPVTYMQYLKADNVDFSRPVYPYPVQARYTAKGDMKDAANWRSFNPKAIN